MAIDQGILAALAKTNLISMAEAQGFYAILGMGDAVASQRAVDQIREAAVVVILRKVSKMNPAEAVALLNQISGNDLAEQLNLLAGPRTES